MINKSPAFWISRGKYAKTETAKKIIWLSGILSFDNGKTDVIELTDRLLSGRLDFNTVIGWFRIVAYDKEDHRWYFFGDNSDSQHFFYDECAGTFSDSLLFYKKERGKAAKPDYRAIAEMIGVGFTVGENTILEGIHRTEKDSCYCCDGNKIIRFSKGLSDFYEHRRKMDLLDVLFPIYEQIRHKKSAAVCTGGTDSRAVIAALAHLGAHPRYIITGHDDNPDIQIARRISERQGIPLEIINPEEKSENWIEQGFAFSDGEYDVVLSYRHLLKANWAKDNGIEYEFGGLAGEFYKNVFCHPFRWAGKNKNAAFYYNAYLKADLRRVPWIGEKLKQAEDDDESVLRSVPTVVEKERSLLAKGNRLGFDILSWKSSAITNGYASVATKIDPLMDRQLCASASGDPWLYHVMHRWQRQQIRMYCPSIADIPTDQGYSCSLNPLLFIRDQIKKSSFYLGRILNRLRRKLGLGFTSKEQHFWDKDYRDAMNTSCWKMALQRCRELGIIDPFVSENKIPLDKTGWILLIGMMFDA